MTKKYVAMHAVCKFVEHELFKLYRFKKEFLAFRNKFSTKSMYIGNIKSDFYIVQGVPFGMVAIISSESK